MKKAFLLSAVIVSLILGCAGRGPHIRWASDLDAGLDKAGSSGQPIIIEFSSPT